MSDERRSDAPRQRVQRRRPRIGGAEGGVDRAAVLVAEDDDELRPALRDRVLDRSEAVFVGDVARAAHDEEGADGLIEYQLRRHAAVRAREHVIGGYWLARAAALGLQLVVVELPGDELFVAL